ncbi:hypothetical protein CK203_031577 [Vitis vinifera]|uniref:Uncharacterized protein n=1 Tax=Vitis vinifera TaxID=29760 RepID=A0A438IFW7_VITVI|nr:hypothetical protein CK203_084812 [Vitis vinifera]RVW95631.1 hypothetical protein CK203_031577 [Vitis vinifera]
MEEGPPANDVCSVCHGGFNIPFQANCSHWFCGSLSFIFFLPFLLIGLWNVKETGE